MTVEIEIRGIRELQRRLGEFRANDILRPPMERSLARLVSDLARYPPARSGQRYVRTGLLGRSWTSSITQVSGGLTGRAGNNVVYGPYVQSAIRQARMHRGRWQTDERVAEANRDAILRDFERAIAEAI